MAEMIFKPYLTLTFAEIWPDYNSFKADYDSLIVSFGGSPVKATNVPIIYYLLVASYGNNPIVNSDVNLFKMKVLSVIYTDGPLWERKQEIQASLRALTEEDLLIGAKQIYNHAFNPSSEPSTDSLEELTYINDQNTANHKKSKMEAYSILWSILHSDQTKYFIDRFRKFFAVFVDKMCVPFYISDEDEEEENEI